jgi:protein-S-isoprenylcysteine O-methyltransferase Ste14
MMSTNGSKRLVMAVKYAVRSSSLLLVFGIVLFLSAGDWGWGDGWLFFGTLFLSALVGMTVVGLRNEKLVDTRVEISEETKDWDKVFLRAGTLLMLAVVVVAGLDERHGWSAPLPVVLQAIGWVVLVGISRVLSSWALSENKFWSGSVWIQDGHQVCDTGPYRLVRHPGYLSALTQWLSAPLILSSYWAFIPAVLFAISIVLRTRLEDRTLQEELPGYEAFAQRTRYKLLPGLW